MGLIASTMVRLLKAQPYEMPTLDILAERMNAATILKKDRFHRYYKSSILPIPCLAYSDILIFNANYYQMLSPDEVLAVAAHEFNHIAKKHVSKRLPRTVLPAAMLSAVMGYLFFIYSSSLLYIISVVGLSFFLFLFGSYYLNARWFRKQEVESDLSAVEFVNGYAMISALARLGPERTSWLSKLLPHTHPTLEQRIQVSKQLLAPITRLTLPLQLVTALHTRYVTNRKSNVESNPNLPTSTATFPGFSWLAIVFLLLSMSIAAG